MGILLKTLRAHHNHTHCQQGSCSWWACMCSSNVVFHWHMHLEHQQSWEFGSSPPLCCCIWSNSSFGFNHCLWHPTILALRAIISYFVWPCCESVLCMCVQSLLLLQVTEIGKNFGDANKKSSGILKIYLIFEFVMIYCYSMERTYCGGFVTVLNMNYSVWNS
jgi:hypothetical protein